MIPHEEGIWHPKYEQNHSQSEISQLQPWSSQIPLQKTLGTLQPREMWKKYVMLNFLKGKKKMQTRKRSSHWPLTMTILLSTIRLLASSADFISAEAGPLCFFRYSTIPSASRGPLYSSIDFPPFLKILRVGKPLLSNSDASSLFASSLASTLARIIGGSWLLSIEAAFSYYKLENKRVHVNELRI